MPSIFLASNLVLIDLSNAISEGVWILEYIAVGRVDTFSFLLTIVFWTHVTLISKYVIIHALPILRFNVYPPNNLSNTIPGEYGG